MRILFFFLVISTNILANQPEWIPDYFVRYEKDLHPLDAGSRIRISCEFDSDYDQLRELRLGMNGSNERIKLTDKNDVEIIRNAQKAVFQFYYNSRFREIETDSIEIKAGQITIISLHFKTPNNIKTVKKPVIYLYPESETEISIDLKTKGDLTFTYPEYSNGWKGTAHTDGSITIAGRKYPYLFWESEQQFNSFDQKIGGFIIKKEDVVESLEKHLTELGFNDREKTDFITFWGPQLAKHEFVLIQFLINEACNVFASIDIHPIPAHLNRVYLIWIPFNMNTSQIPLIKAQELPPLIRDGFDVLEWGGLELMSSPD